MNREDEELTFKIPDKSTIPCLTCKWGMHSFLASYCIKYNLKPKEVLYESKSCPKYEKYKKDID